MPCMTQRLRRISFFGADKYNILRWYLVRKNQGSAARIQRTCSTSTVHLHLAFGS